jgi:hypothetical protein
LFGHDGSKDQRLPSCQRLVNLSRRTLNSPRRGCPSRFLRGSHRRLAQI